MPTLSPKKGKPSKKKTPVGKRKRSEGPDDLAPETPSAEGGEVVRNGDGSVAATAEQPKKMKKKDKGKRKEQATDSEASSGKKKKKKKRLSEAGAN